MSVGELGRRMGWDRMSSMRVESGERGVSFEEVCRLAKVLRIPITRFVWRDV